MPIIKSAKKALRVAARRKTENDLVRAKVKSAVKGLAVGIKNGDQDTAALLSVAFKELDLAAKKNVIHKNKASRLKSRLSKKITAAPAAAPVKATKAKAKAKTKKK
jgi:small subunit ribosomal protein S20